MRIIAYFLPQFYSIPENDKHWGENFTDWVNAKNAKQYFPDHRSPLIPTLFGYYDLSDKETIKLLCDYSIDKGVDGFAYWHYWFGNKKQALEKVPQEHLRNKAIKQNFFFCWANTNWTKSWVGDEDTIIIKQKYNKQSAIDHFNYLKPFFDDSRYIRKDGKPVMQVINSNIKKAQDHIILLEKLSVAHYGHGIHWIFPEIKNNKHINNQGLSFSLVGFPPGEYTKANFLFKIKRKLQKFNIYNKPIVISEDSYLKNFKNIEKKISKNNYIPCLISGWDNTPRYKKRGFILNASISSLLSKQFKILTSIIDKKNIDIDFVFIKAWNEWAEGNVLEPHKTIDMDDVPTDVIENFRKKQSKTLID